MKKVKNPHFISSGGVLVALTVLFQAAPVLLPGVGMALSPISTMSVALAALFSMPLGVTVLFSSALTILVISPQEAVILLLATGPLGVALGAGIRKDEVITFLMSTISLFSGLNILTFVVGIPAFGGFTASFSKGVVISIFLFFSLGYAALWIFIFKNCLRYLKKIKALGFLFDNQPLE